METIFSLLNLMALLGWISLFIFYPRKWIYSFLFSGVLVVLALAYLYFIIQGLGKGEGGFGSLAEVATLFRKEEALLAGWIHYLAFDLFVGMWITKDAWDKGINRWLLLPCLAFTFMLGPVGLFTYLLLRIFTTKKLVQSPFVE
jgi:hypothetical protein